MAEVTFEIPAPGIIKKGLDGITPHIGENGHWYIGCIDTGVSAAGQDGISAYESAVTGGFTGTLVEFYASLSSIGNINEILNDINGEIL